MPIISFKSGWERKAKPTVKSTEYFAENFNPGFPGRLGLRVSPKGKMTWFIAYRVKTKPTLQKMNVGDYPNMTFTDAKKRATAQLEAIDKGLDPAQAKQQRREAPDMNKLWQAYVEKRNNAAKPKAASTISEEDRRWYNVIKPALAEGKFKVADVEPVMLDEILTEVAKTAPVSANRLHSLLGLLFKPALAKGWIKVHPLQWIDKPGGEEQSRKRVLSDEEIKRLWPWFEQETGNAGDILKLGVLTAQRPGEIMSMRWEDIDMDEAIWTNQDTKTDEDVLVPLSVQVVKILEARKRRGEYVFDSAYNRNRKGYTGDNHTKSTKDARRRIKAKSGITEWTAHDLRRTARTIMSRLKIQPHVRELVLGHSQGKIAKTYDLHDYVDEKRKALQKLADEIYMIVNGQGRKKAKIRKMRSAI